MARFQHLLFVCTNERDPENPKGCCVSKGSRQLLDRLKELTAQHNLKGKVRVVGSGCLDYCSKGCTVVALSNDAPAAETWYTHLGPGDADELFNTHILQKQRLEAHVERSGDRQRE